MADEQKNTENNSSDGTENTAQENRQEHMIPKARFDEMNKRARDAERLAAELQKKQQERDEADRLAKGEHEKIIAELKPKAEAAVELEKTVDGIFQTRLQSVPEELRDLVPAGTAAFRLAWLENALAKGLFKKPDPPITDAGASGSPAAPVKLTDEQKQQAKKAGMSDEQFAKALKLTSGKTG